MQTIILTRTERLALAAANRRERVRKAVAVAHEGIADGLDSLHALLDEDGWAELDLAVRSDAPLGDFPEGELDSGIAGQDLDVLVMG